MFTGLVRELGIVESLRKRADITKLAVRSEEISKESQLGDSISVNGVCLTVTSLEGELLSFDLSDETLRNTNLGMLKKGDYVNLEPSLRPSDRLGGHIVTGHVDGIGRIKSKTRVGETFHVEIETPEALMRYIVKKGSIAVDGISLTVADLSERSFKVVIIPHTAKVTTIGYKKVGDTVNLETDIIGKYIEKFITGVTRGGESTLMEKLREGGFI
jgi:riboflavin synthase